MRVTIQKTISLDDMPSEIMDNQEVVHDMLEELCQLSSDAYSDANDGRYIDSSEVLDMIRQKLVFLDKSIEELQSLCISYEKIRIAQQEPASVPSGEDGDA